MSGPIGIQLVSWTTEYLLIVPSPVIWLIGSPPRRLGLFPFGSAPARVNMLVSQPGQLLLQFSESLIENADDFIDLLASDDEWRRKAEVIATFPFR